LSPAAGLVALTPTERCTSTSLLLPSRGFFMPGGPSSNHREQVGISIY
jgi:hypothetical protein